MMDLTKLMEACEKYSVELTINGKMLGMRYESNGKIFKRGFTAECIKSLRREVYEELIERFVDEVKAEMKRLCVFEEAGTVDTMEYLGGDRYV